MYMNTSQSCKKVIFIHKHGYPRANRDEWIMYIPNFIFSRVRKPQNRFCYFKCPDKNWIKTLLSDLAKTAEDYFIWKNGEKKDFYSD